MAATRALSACDSNLEHSLMSRGDPNRTVAISWSSSIPSLSSASSSMTSISLSSHSSDNIMSYNGDKSQVEPCSNSTNGKRSVRKYHSWTNLTPAKSNHTGSNTLKRSSWSPFSRFQAKSRHRIMPGPRHYISLEQFSLWEKIMFVLFCISFWILVHALAGFGSRGPGQDVFLDASSQVPPALPSRTASLEAGPVPSVAPYYNYPVTVQAAEPSLERLPTPINMPCMEDIPGGQNV